ncbi:RidA family protein [Nocardia grenadensis]|uniref:RidA family protein n=1 Tax=Nocardia grenadensis TaxID=931537 RepID=UPI003D752884
MSIEISNPAGLHDPVPFGYSHVAVTSGELVFVAGQYDSDGQGATTTGDFAGQVERAFANLGTALRSVGLDFADIAQLRTHIVDHGPDKLAVVGAKIAEIWGDRPPVQTLTGVAALALPAMLFEVDAVAVRP